MNNELDSILSSIQQKDTSVLCREVTSIGDTMDVLRAKWNVEILTAILYGQTRKTTLRHRLSDDGVGHGSSAADAGIKSSLTKR